MDLDFKKILIFDKLLIILAILLLGVFKPDIVLIVFYFILIIYLLITKRRLLLFHLSISSLLSLIWILISKNEYSYNQDFLIIMGFNIFPFFAFSLGLFSVYLIYSHYQYLIKGNSYLKKLLLFIIIYFPLLIIVETISYHLFNIRNLASSMYSGLPFCDCLHAKKWMQIFYFLMGPLFFTVCYVLKIKNIHLQKLLNK
tara:strand:- start:357 stop:953 length:597 start_codon:yes stop_codon:yes gene_type:complete